MRIQPSDREGFIVDLDRDELTFINNAINEVCNGLDISEFSTRLGYKREEAEALLDEIGRALE